MSIRIFILVFAFICLASNAVSQTSINLPSEVCAGDTIEIEHAISANYYSWNFCVPDVGNTPTAANIGNPGGLLNVNAFADIVFDSATGNYFMFATNYFASNIVRLDFGNSPLNTPTATNLGTFGGLLPPQLEGIQIAKDGNNWYGFVVGGQTSATARLIRLEFGTNLTNTPVAVNLGNIGSMAWPHEYQIVKDNDMCFGIAANRGNNRITIHNFGNSLTNIPTGSSYVLQNTTGATNIMAIKNGLNWHVFVNSLFHGFTRLDYGNSILNIPNETSFGNLNNSLNPLPRGLIILKDCSKYVGYIGHKNSTILKLNFIDSLTGSINVTNLGNISNAYNKVNHFSPITFNGYLHLFSVSDAASTIQRMDILLCNSTPFSASNDFAPDLFTFTDPGLYQISILGNTGRGIQTAICSETNVMGNYDTTDVILCEGVYYTMQNGTILTESGIYFDTLNHDADCTDILTIKIVKPYPIEISIISQTDVTFTEPGIGSIELSVTGGSGPPYSYNWSPYLPNTNNPTGLTSGLYIVTVTDNNGCTNTASIYINQDLNIAIPNAFTPDGDGTNDRFTISFSDTETLQILSFKIYNRWGKLIYDSPSIDGWDGRYNGVYAPQDVYIYIIELSNVDGTIEVIQGDVTLLR